MNKLVGDEVELVKWLEAEIARYQNGPVITYIREGHSVNEAAEKFRLRAPTIKRIIRLVELGTESRKQRVSKIREQYQAAVRMEAKELEDERVRTELFRMSADGLGLREMAIRVGRGIDRTRELLNKYGLTWAEKTEKEQFAALKAKREREISAQMRRVAPRLNPGRPDRRETEAEDEHNDMRSKISAMQNNDRVVRTPGKVSLPYVKILDGVEW